MKGKYGVLAGAILIQLILGTVYGYSIFWQPLDAQADLPENQANYAFAICILSFAVTMVLAGRIQDVTGPRLPAIVGAVLMGSGFLLAGMMQSPIVLYLSHAAFTGVVVIVLLMIFHALFSQTDRAQHPVLQYVPMGIVSSVIVAGVLLGTQYVGQLGRIDRLFMLWGTVGFLAGAGIGFAYVCPIAALVKWFPASKGLVSGIAVAGFGFGAYIFASQRLPFSAENYIKAHGITQLFLVHGAVCLVAIIAGAMLLRNPPDIKQPAAKSDDSAPPDPSESSWQDTLRRPAFYMLWLMFFSGSMAGLMVIGILKPFAGSQLVTAAMAGSVSIDEGLKQELLDKGVKAVGWLAVFNAVGRVAWGFFSDRIGRTSAMTAMFIFQAVMMFILAGMKTEMALAVAASLIGFNYGGIFALFPSATADLFGAKNLGANYGWVFTSYGIAGVVGMAAGNLAMQLTGSYTVAFLFASGLCVVSALLAIALHVTSKRQAESR